MMNNFPNKTTIVINPITCKMGGTKLACLWPYDKNLPIAEAITKTLLNTGFIDQIINIKKVKDNTFEVDYLDNLIYSADGIKYLECNK